jgi:hypothetical protein
LSEIHVGTYRGHIGARALTAKVLWQGFYLPTIIDDAAKFISTCEACQKFSRKSKATTPVGLLLLVMNVSFGDGTIRTSRGEAHCKSLFLACQLLVFLAPPRYRVVKIACSCSEVVLRTMKNYKAHYSLSWFRTLLRDNRSMSSIFVIEGDE